MATFFFRAVASDGKIRSGSLTLAQRAFIAAAILARPAADILRLG